MDLTKLTMDELISLRNKIEGLIHSYEDGYFYICSVRQFGSVWEERPSSLYSLKELCVNTMVTMVLLMFIPTTQIWNFLKWSFKIMVMLCISNQKMIIESGLNTLKTKNLIEDVTQRLDEWDESKDLPFKYRPSFAPHWTREDVSEWVENLKIPSGILLNQDL
jgi:hypothetical protein